MSRARRSGLPLTTVDGDVKHSETESLTCGSISANVVCVRGASGQVVVEGGIIVGHCQTGLHHRIGWRLKDPYSPSLSYVVCCTSLSRL